MLIHINFSCTTFSVAHSTAQLFLIEMARKNRRSAGGRRGGRGRGRRISTLIVAPAGANAAADEDNATN